MDNPIAANVLGTLGAVRKYTHGDEIFARTNRLTCKQVCWSIQLIPQILINYRRHSTEGLQRSMMLLWALAGVPLGVYNIVSGFNIALLIQPQILTTLSLITWIQCFYYEDKWPKRKCGAAAAALGLFLGGVEFGLVFALRAGVRRGVTWPVVLMGVLSAVLLSAGVLRHYYDIYIHRTVRGISFIFVGIDAAGDVFSLVSVFFQPELDILGMVIYASEFVLWCGVFACGGYFNLLPWLRLRHSARKVSRHGEDPRDASAIQEPVYDLGHEGNGNGLELRRAGSSTSVFRTPSSMLSVRNKQQPEVR